MKILKLGLIFLSIALFLFACTQSQTTNVSISNNTSAVINSNANVQPSNMPDELASARKIYNEKCVKCHKEDGTGGTIDIEGTKIKSPSFKSEQMLKDKDADWIDTIENGAKEDGMPAFKGKISDDDIKNLVKLIRRDFQSK